MSTDSNFDGQPQKEPSMIIAVNNSNRDIHSQLVRQMFELRAEVFHGRLGWDVQVEQGLEIDVFDREADPLYLMAVDDYGNLKGSLRLLPTTGPNMLRDVFSELLPPGERVESPLIWESTRFCVTKSAGAEITSRRLNRTTGELLAGIVEIGQQAGLISVVSVYDALMKRILTSAGCPAEVVGTPTKIGKVTTYAGLFAIDDEMLARIRDASGLVGPVLVESVTINRLAA
jgi:acyl homoserine lactone synthase